jgi:hypothetical protein
MVTKRQNLRELIKSVALVSVAMASLGQRVAASTLDFITSTWPEANLKAVLDPADQLQIDQGSTFKLRLSTSQDASVLIVLTCRHSSVH